MPSKLTDINITHISLVKAGANGKQFIYKSAIDPGGYEHTIDIKKTDEEQGIVYGIVYAPGEVDSQGDFADADEIKKAAYNFMKSLNVKNVDVDHSFKNEDAFVAESWIVKSGDSVFADEPEGSWAVAIKLESEELRKSARDGDLQGLSMAGVANKTEVHKSDESAFKKLFSAFADAVSDVWFDFGGVIKKSKGEDNDMSKEIENFGKQIKKKLQDATAPVAAALEKANKEHIEKIETLEKSVAEANEKIETITKENETLKEENAKLAKDNEKLTKDLESHNEKIETLEKKAEETAETLKQSNQRKPVKKADDTKKDDTKGTL